MANEKFYQVGMKALVVNSRGQVLLLKSGEGFHRPHWDFPGGRIQEGQTAVEALRREIEEETGITAVSDIEFFQGCISNHELTFQGKKPVGLVLMTYKITVPEDAKIVLSDEHTEFEWVSMPEAAERLKDKYPPELTELLHH
jgi:8-oxo-dGTP pyrophosphatase MutT (NUDIX family)